MTREEGRGGGVIHPGSDEQRWGGRQRGKRECTLAARNGEGGDIYRGGGGRGRGDLSQGRQKQREGKGGTRAKIWHGTSEDDSYQMQKGSKSAGGPRVSSCPPHNRPTVSRRRLSSTSTAPRPPWWPQGAAWSLRGASTRQAQQPPPASASRATSWRQRASTRWGRSTSRRPGWQRRPSPPSPDAPSLQPRTLWSVPKVRCSSARCSLSPPCPAHHITADCTCCNATLMSF